MQTLVQDYLQPLHQANPPVISYDMVFLNVYFCFHEHIV